MLLSNNSMPLRNKKFTIRAGLKVWMIGLVWLLLLLLLVVQGGVRKSGARFQAVQMAVPPVVACSVQPFDLSEVKLLDGPFKRAMNLNAKYLLSLSPDRFLHYFQVNAGLKPKAPAYGGWESPNTGAGRCLGHYLSALSLQYQATGDRRFKDRVDYIVSELAKCQQTNGFLSAEANVAQAFSALAAGHGDALFKSRVPWYIQHKMFAGLRDAYELTGNQQARQILIRLANWAVAVTSNLDHEQFQIMLQQEYGGMLEVLVNVYALTGDSRYLDLARRFRDANTFDPLEAGVDRLDGMHANTMIPKIVGAVRLYEWTGEKSQRRLSEYFWNQVVDHHTYVIGGISNHEHFGPPNRLGLDAETCETCDTYNMLKLTRDLFCLHPRVQYGDYYERALYNDILASQDPKRGMFTYFMSLKPGHFKTYSTPFNSFWCCVGTGMENHTKYGNSIYFHDADDLYVNLYIPSQLTWPDKNVVIRQETDYPVTGNMRFTLKCSHPVTFAFQFRYPGWADPGMTIAVNGQPVMLDAHPGEFVKLARQWKDGDLVELKLPLSLRSESLSGAPEEKAFLYGPLVLAGDLGTNNLPAPIPYATDPQQFVHVADPNVPVLVVDHQPLKNWLQPVAGQPLTFHAVNVGQSEDVVLRPFYQLYYHRYTVYWKVSTPGQWKDNK
jgi:uncharacterized protein